MVAWHVILLWQLVGMLCMLPVVFYYRTLLSRSIKREEASIKRELDMIKYYEGLFRQIQDAILAQYDEERSSMINMGQFGGDDPDDDLVH
jgi:hypothetical protein